MKRLLLLVIAGWGLWALYQHQDRIAEYGAGDEAAGEFIPGESQAGQLQPHDRVIQARNNRAGLLDETTYQCDGRKYCSQMTSRAEAEYFHRHCPDTNMDDDGDGTPCENETRF